MLKMKHYRQNFNGKVELPPPHMSIILIVESQSRGPLLTMLLNLPLILYSLTACFLLSTGLFKGSTTTLDGIGLRPMPAERPKTLRKLKSVYDASPTEPPAVNTANLSSNGQATDRSVNGVEDEVRRRSNTTSSTQSGDKSLSILSPFDEQVFSDLLFGCSEKRKKSTYFAIEILFR